MANPLQCLDKLQCFFPVPDIFPLIRKCQIFLQNVKILIARRTRLKCHTKNFKTSQLKCFFANFEHLLISQHFIFDVTSKFRPQCTLRQYMAKAYYNFQKKIGEVQNLVDDDQRCPSQLNMAEINFSYKPNDHSRNAFSVFSKQ